MGMNFAALVRCHRTREVVRNLNALEGALQPISLEVQTLWREQRFFPLGWRRAQWVARDNARQVKRPQGPDLSVSLRTVDGFLLTFGRGACCLWHLLRWQFFLTDERWQQAMLSACETMADLLQARDGVVMSDFHPAYAAFFAGNGFDACLAAAPPEEGEVATLADLYQPGAAGEGWTSHGFWRFRQDSPKLP